MTTTKADAHDLEKLERWGQGLEGENKSAFPVCAIFLIAGEDQLSHDIFRKYRASFEDRKAEFHHLIIFGQHGISSTVTRLLDQFDLPLESLPYLAIASGVRAREVTLFNLPPGGHPGPAPALEREDNLHQPWRLVLDRVETAVEKGSALVDLSGISGGKNLPLGGETLTGLVKGLLTTS